MEETNKSPENIKTVWDSSIGGVIIGLFIHLIVTIISAGLIEQLLGAKAKAHAIQIVANFFISRAYIKYRAEENGIKGSFWLGLKVSGIIVLICAAIETAYILIALYS